MRTITTLPFIDGFRLPAEFEEHACSILLWPERRDIWRNGARPVQLAITKLITEISKFEKVIVGVTSSQFMNAKNLLPENVQLMEVSYDDIWIRDTGPTFIKNRDSIRGVDWTFNAWGGVSGGSYFPWNLDELLAQKVLEWFSTDRYKSTLVVEGGAFNVDGEGTLIAIKDCILNTNRNPKLTLEKVEKVFSDYLGIKKFIWLNEGLYLEENNGHIDNMCSFLKPGEVVLAWTDNKEDPQYEISRDAFDILSNATDLMGRQLIVHKVKIPKALYISEDESLGIEHSQFAIPRLKGDLLPASYINFYFVNGGIILPKFGCEEDDITLQQFKKYFPSRNIVQIDSREFLIGGGGIHCLTQQVPKL